MKRVLVVAMADSIHTARWVSQFRNESLSIVIFPSTPHRRIHPLLRELLEEESKVRVSIAPMMGVMALPLFLVDTIFRSKIRARILRGLIRRQKPEIVHGLETQHAGYLIADALPNTSDAPTVYLTLWGSDLIWFRSSARHRKKISTTLSTTDFLGVECRRDIELAQSLGFRGKLLPVMPASGSLNTLRSSDPGRFTAPSQRKKIAVKGYTGFVGRSRTALRGLSALASELAGYEIHVYSASFSTILYAYLFVKRRGLRVTCHKKHSLSHPEVLSLFAESRISVSVSLSDGFPGSLKEAMATGCFPIESDRSCGCEWADSGKSAFFVNPEDLSGIIRAIQIALLDDHIVDSAATINQALAEKRFSAAVVNDLIPNYYSYR